MDINFGDYSAHPEFVAVLNELGITYEQYKEDIARKHRFSTVKFLLDNYHRYKSDLLDKMYLGMLYCNIFLQIIQRDLMHLAHSYISH